MNIKDIDFREYNFVNKCLAEYLMWNDICHKCSVSIECDVLRDFKLKWKKNLSIWII